MANLQGAAVTWLGHSTVLIETAKGTKILIDPWMKENPQFPKSYKLPEKLDLMLLTHGHFDHTGDAVKVAKEHKPTVLGIFELTTWLGGEGVKDTTGMNLGGSFKLKDVTVTMVEAKHSSAVQDGSELIYAGVAAGYVMELEGGPTLYHSGDTSVFGDMQLIRELYAPALAMLPIGGYYTMGPRQAALAVKLLGATTVLPLHFGSMPVLTGTPEELKRELENRGTSGIEVLQVKPGETVR